MADELSNYKLQLQQVEVALLTDPDNAELLKLKEDIGIYMNIGAKLTIIDDYLLIFQNNSLNYNRN